MAALKPNFVDKVDFEISPLDEKFKGTADSWNQLKNAAVDHADFIDQHEIDIDLNEQDIAINALAIFNLGIEVDLKLETVTTDGITITGDGTVGDPLVSLASGVTDHTLLSNIGVNPHSVIDTHLANLANPHSSSLSNLIDTLIAAISVNDMLYFNGSEWVNDGGSIMNYYNGTFKESFDALVTSDGTTITMTLEQQGGGDLSMRFSDGITILDCTPIQTIALTEGTDTVPKKNYIYILKSTKVLTKSTTDWPTDEHIKIGFFFVQSATFVNTANRGALINQNWNDHSEGSNGMGHGAHIAEAIRMGTGYFSGIDGNGTSDYLAITTNVGVPDNIHWKSTSGFSYQLHKHGIPLKDTSLTDVIHVVNDNTVPYRVISDIAAALTDSTGGSLSGRYYNLVLGIVANKTGEYTPVMMNLPSGSYSNESDAISDVSEYNGLSIPREFNKDSTTATSVVVVTLKHSTASGGTWTLINTKDIRGGINGGGSTSSSLTEFSDGQFKWFNSADITKIVEVDLSELDTATTRVLTAPNKDGKLALLSDILLQLAGAYSDEITDLATGQVWSKRIGIAFSLTGHKFDVVTAPTGQAITLDTKKNGTSIWSVKPTIAIGAFVETAGTLVTNPTIFAIGDLMTEHIDAVGTTIKGAGLKGDPIGTLTI